MTFATEWGNQQDRGENRDRFGHHHLGAGQQLLKLPLDSSKLVRSELHHQVYKNLSAKIESCLTDDIRKEYKYTPPATHIDIPVSNDSADSDQIYLILEKAISSSHQVDLKYESISSGLSERIVDPYFIVFKGHAFYFVGFCHKHNEFRTFRLNRIKEINPLEKIFYRQDNIDPKKYFEGSWLIFSGEPVKVELIFWGSAKKIIESSSHHTDEKIEKIDDDSLRYSIVVNGLIEIQRWILGFGEEVEVVKPKEMRTNLKNIGQYLSKKYK